MEEMTVCEMISIADVVSLQFITGNQEKNWPSGSLSVRKLSIVFPQSPWKAERATAFEDEDMGNIVSGAYGRDARHRVIPFTSDTFSCFVQHESSEL